MKLEVVLSHRTIAIGMPIEGEVAVVEGGHSRRLALRLVFRELTPDFAAAVRFHESDLLAEGEGDLEAGARYPFRVTLPSDALPGYESEYGRLWWDLEAYSDEPGLDTVARSELQVLPAGADVSDAALAAPHRSFDAAVAAADARLRGLDPPP